jgi:hypothetical protein
MGVSTPAVWLDNRGWQDYTQPVSGTDFLPADELPHHVIALGGCVGLKFATMYAVQRGCNSGGAASGRR